MFKKSSNNKKIGVYNPALPTVVDPYKDIPLWKPSITQKILQLVSSYEPTPYNNYLGRVRIPKLVKKFFTKKQKLVSTEDRWNYLNTLDDEPDINSPTSASEYIKRNLTTPQEINDRPLTSIDIQIFLALDSGNFLEYLKDTTNFTEKAEIIETSPTTQNYNNTESLEAGATNHSNLSLNTELEKKGVGPNEQNHLPHISSENNNSTIKVIENVRCSMEGSALNFEKILDYTKEGFSSERNRQTDSHNSSLNYPDNSIITQHKLLHPIAPHSTIIEEKNLLNAIAQKERLTNFDTAPQLLKVENNLDRKDLKTPEKSPISLPQASPTILDTVLKNKNLDLTSKDLTLFNEIKNMWEKSSSPSNMVTNVEVTHTQVKSPENPSIPKGLVSEKREYWKNKAKQNSQSHENQGLRSR